MTRIKRLVFGLMATLFCVFLFFTLAGMLAPYVPVPWWPALQLLPAATPVLALFLLMFLVYFLRQRKALWFSLALLALMGAGWVLSQEVRPPLNSRGEGEDLRVISYNVATFRYEANQAQRIATFLRSQRPDVITLQEFRNQDMGNGQKAVEFLSRALEMPYYRFEHLPEHRHGAVIFSRYPITSVDTLFMPLREINTGIIATLETPQGPLGVGNIHLSSYQVSKLLEDKRDAIENRWDVMQLLYQRTLEVLPLQQDKVDQILAGADQYPHPLILTGDFNAVPHSRIVHQFSRRYTDSFIASGGWLGWTYPLLGPWGLRIDYQFASEEVQPLRHRVLHSRESDHYPIEVYYRLAR